MRRVRLCWYHRNSWRWLDAPGFSDLHAGFQSGFREFASLVWRVLWRVTQLGGGGVAGFAPCTSKSCLGACVRLAGW
eukprot:873504-Amphidinium_carterae.2